MSYENDYGHERKKEEGREEGGGIGHASLAKLPACPLRRRCRPSLTNFSRRTDGRNGVTRVFLLFRPRRRSHAYLFLSIWDPEFLLMHQAIGMILYNTVSIIRTGSGPRSMRRQQVPSRPRPASSIPYQSLSRFSRSGAHYVMIAAGGGRERERCAMTNWE